VVTNTDSHSTEGGGKEFKMERRFETKRMYRVWNVTKESEIYFTSKEEAERYKNMCENFGETICLNVWLWEVKIEK
jgi:hypothetical protein